MAHLVVVPIKLQVAVPARPCLRRRANLLLEAREPERFLVESVFWVVVQGRDARLEKVGVGPDRRRVRVADPPDGADREDRVERRILVAMCIFGYVRNWSMTLMGSIPSEQKTHADLRPSEVLLGDWREKRSATGSVAWKMAVCCSRTLSKWQVKLTPSEQCDRRTTDHDADRTCVP